MKNLAINGGPKVRSTPFICQRPINSEEINAVMQVLNRGQLSSFRGNSGGNFFGGPEIQALEKEWAHKMGAVYAVAVNSCTSALQIACKAVGLGVGDEVIVTPWSMTCSATAPLVWGAVPIFADIEKEYFCLDPKLVKKKLSPLTKAIIVVDLFGQPHDAEAINEIAEDNGIWVIEDAAQAIGTTYKNRLAGTLGDIGVYSLTTGKHLTSGEGGMIVTNDESLALNCRLLRNHAEAVINDLLDNKMQPATMLLNLAKTLPWMVDNVIDHMEGALTKLQCMVGFNMRMTEIQATIARQQLSKLDHIVSAHQKNSAYLYNLLSAIPAIEIPPVRERCTHSYYVQPLLWKDKLADGLPRDVFLNAVKAELAPEEGRENEGVPIGGGYIKPLYLMPIFQGGRFPYPKGFCPTVEHLWEKELFLHRFVGPMLSQEDLNDVSEAFEKVWRYRKELK